MKTSGSVTGAPLPLQRVGPVHLGPVVRHFRTAMSLDGRCEAPAPTIVMVARPAMRVNGRAGTSDDIARTRRRRSRRATGDDERGGRTGDDDSGQNLPD